MKPNIIVVGLDRVYKRIKSRFRNYNLTYIKDIYLLSDILSPPSIIFGDGLSIPYIKSIIDQIKDDKLNWIKYIYLDYRDVLLSGLNPENLIESYSKLIESNKYLDTLVTISKFPDRLSRRNLLKNEVIEEYSILTPFIKDLDVCRSLDKCKLCIGMCPFDAIIDMKPPEIDDRVCMECGYCINSCPSLLYVSPEYPLDSFELLLRTLRVGGDLNKYLLIIDRLKKIEYYDMVKARKYLTLIHMNNPLYLSIYHLMISIIYGYTPVIYVDFNREGFTEYNKLISEFNSVSKVDVIILDSLDEFIKKDFTRYEDEVKYPSKLLSGSYEDILINFSSYIDEDSLNKTLDRVPIYDVELDTSKCTLCEACTHYCPSNALKIESNGDLIRLSFNQVKCIGCMGCEAVCPEDAVKVVRRIGPDMTRYHELTMDKIARCIECGSPIAPEKSIQLIESRLRSKGVSEDFIKYVRLCKKCRMKYSFRDLYGLG